MGRVVDPVRVGMMPFLWYLRKRYWAERVRRRMIGKSRNKDRLEAFPRSRVFIHKLKHTRQTVEID